MLLSLSLSLPAAWGVAGVGVVAETGVVGELLLAAAARAAPRCMNFMVMRREDMVLAAGASFMGRRYSFWVDLGGGMVAVLWCRYATHRRRVGGWNLYGPEGVGNESLV